MGNATTKENYPPAASSLSYVASPVFFSPAASTKPTDSPFHELAISPSNKLKDNVANPERQDSFHARDLEKVAARPRGPHSRITPWLMFVIVFASMTGLLMGYDLAVVSVVLTPVVKHFKICGDASMCPQKEVFVAMIAPGALLGSIAGGMIADMYGRRWAMGVRDVAVIIGTVVQATATSYEVMLFGRAMLGFGVGIGFVAFATYVSEVSPTDRRGQMVMIQECSQCAGVLLSSLIVVAAGRDGDDGAWRCDVDGAWRWLLGGPAIVAAINVLSHTFAWLYVSISPMSREP
eukprot:GHVS01070523.1.p1 GENE.GHVS01070523.1~~GHVS01070523.1.p1  ORF type:complete len:292 (-),score=46.99 GHVS01070523.1:337-1212(-)